MKPKSQKEIFINGEGDAWLKRNKREGSISSENMQVNKFILEYLLSLPIPNSKKIKLMEVGCGDGSLLFNLKKKRKWQLYGIDPSKKAIKIAKDFGINASVSTAEKLPFDDDTFDLIIFGFCLYLCDTTDLFKIAYEAHRTLKNRSWLMIIDFWSPELKKIPYKHKEGVFSSKFDFSKMFSWHPSYIKYDHLIRDFAEFKYTDNKDNWLAVTTLRKIEN